MQLSLLKVTACYLYNYIITLQFNKHFHANAGCSLIKLFGLSNVMPDGMAIILINAFVRIVQIDNFDLFWLLISWKDFSCLFAIFRIYSQNLSHNYQKYFIVLLNFILTVLYSFRDFP